jgi:hypothetical protein
MARVLGLRPVIDPRLAAMLHTALAVAVVVEDPVLLQVFDPPYWYWSMEMALVADATPLCIDRSPPKINPKSMVPHSRRSSRGTTMANSTIEAPSSLARLALR